MVGFHPLRHPELGIGLLKTRAILANKRKASPRIAIDCGDRLELEN